MHGEFWMRVDRLALLTQRSTRSCVVAALGSAELDDVEAFTTMRLDLEAVSMRESAYYERLAEFLAPIRALVIATAILVSIGGALGGVNAMYAAFASRVREAGTLQALGFSRLAIAVSLLVESTVACAAGALLACAVGRFLLDGIAVRFSMGSFGLSVDATAIAAGLAAGLLLGLLGAIAPIVRCLALPIPVALRS
jgi:putative ABC transport system permease protein